MIGRPLLIHPTKAEVVLHALRERFSIEADKPAPEAAARFMARRESGKRTATVGGTAIVSVVGPLANRFSVAGALSGGVRSYEEIDAELRAAHADNDVHSVVLDIDTPGGEATGMFRIAETIRQIRKTKRVVAYVDDMAASAGYGIASAADEIVVSPTSIVGSIGVVLTHIDRSAEMEKAGRKVTLIHAGAHKVDGHPFGPLSEQIKADLQAEVLAFYDQFVGAVVAGRPRLSVEAVKATEARTFIGQEAINRGLADRIASIDLVLEDLGQRNASRTRGNSKGTLSMSENNPAPNAGATFNQADLDRARAEGRDEGVKAGATAERERIGAILNSEEAKGGRMAAAIELALDEAALPAATATRTLSKLPAEAPAAKTPPAPPAGSLADRQAENPLGLMTDADKPEGKKEQKTSGLRSAVDDLIAKNAR